MAAETSTVGLENESRVKKTLLNAKINFVFYFLTIAANFIGRKFFLDYLGADFVGLTGTLLNILGYLNLAELGVSAAISFNLYKPIKEGDRKKVTDIISLLGYYYRNIGFIILGAGIGLSAFLFLIFEKSAFQNYPIIYFAYYTYLISALLGYFVNYRQILLVADQRNYVISSLFQSSNIVKVIVQVFVAIYFQNLFAWIAIELIFGIGYSCILNFKINRVYPWLKSSIARGKKESKNFKHILDSTKQVIIHKIKDFLLTQSDQLFVFVFVSLKMVATYGNYVLITTKLMQLFNTILDSVLASVGNLVAEDDRDKMFNVFWELMAVRYLIAGFICFTLFNVINPFVALWFGREYLLSDLIVAIMMVNLFIMISRGTVDNYNFAFGHFGDVWAAWAELIINVAVTVVGGLLWGIPGILLGKTLSMLPIIVFWKPLYLFRDGLHKPYALYWAETLKYYIYFAACAIAYGFFLHWLPLDPAKNFLSWTLYTLITSVGFGSLYLFCILTLCPGGRNIVGRLKGRLLKSRSPKNLDPN